MVADQQDASNTKTMNTGNKRITPAVVKYADGSIYTGQLTRDGQRTETGTYRYPFIVYGEVTANPDTIIHWMEYVGEWENDEPTSGQLVCVRKDGRRIVQFAGIWKYGSPVEDLSERFVHGAC